MDGRLLQTWTSRRHLKQLTLGAVTTVLGNQFFSLANAFEIFVFMQVFIHDMDVA